MNLENVKPGMTVRTNKILGPTRGMLVKPKHLEARTADSEGVVLGYIPGHGGDCWWIEHEDSELGAYCFDEFEPIKYQLFKQLMTIFWEAITWAGERMSCKS